MAVEAFKCHARIILFRQNIATLDQKLMAAYLRICRPILREIIFIPILISSQPVVKDEMFLKLMNCVNSIDIPCYWVFSTKKDFKEFWSEENVFLKQPSPLPNVTISQKMGNR